MHVSPESLDQFLLLEGSTSCMLTGASSNLKAAVSSSARMTCEVVTSWQVAGLALCFSQNLWNERAMTLACMHSQVA